jgi:hypothetical protein
MYSAIFVGINSRASGSVSPDATLEVATPREGRAANGAITGGRTSQLSKLAVEGGLCALFPI